MSGEERVPLVELMRQCWLGGAGRYGGADDPADSWAQWWTDDGKALMHGYYGPGDMDDHQALLADIHRMVTTNNQALGVMLEAMQEMEPDEVIDKDGRLWTVTAYPPAQTLTADQLHYTVVCHGLEAATAAAAAAWGHGDWSTLRRRRAHTED